MIHILLVDDYPFFRMGLKKFLSQYKEYKVIGDTGIGTEALDLAQKLNPDVIIMGVDILGKNSHESIYHILKQNPDTKVIVFSSFENENDIMEILKAGSKGLLSKSGEMDELILALDKVLNNEEYYSRKAVEVIIRRFAKGNPDVKTLLKTPGFSDRELEIIKHICHQRTAREIGQLLFISEKTVDFHRQKIIEKMNAKNIIGLVVFAIKKGLVDIEELTLA